MFAFNNKISKKQVDKINNVLGLALLPDTMTKILGGDVNTSFQLTDGVNNYFVKLIDESKYKKKFNIDHFELIQQLNFSENIARQLEHTTDTISALCVNHNSVVSISPFFIMVYPWIDGVSINPNRLGMKQIAKAAEMLKLIHHFDFEYDKVLALKKVELFKKIGKLVLNHNIWKLIYLVSDKKYIFPNLYRIVDYIFDNKKCLLECIDNIDANTMCHNDLKPKNFLWGKESQFYLTDWETVGLFNRDVDHLDSLIAWCTVQDEKNAIKIDIERANCFLKNYPVANIPALPYSLDVVFVKSLYWLAFCLNGLIQTPFNSKEYRLHIKESTRLCLMLIESKVVELIQSIQNSLNHE